MNHTNKLINKKMAYVTTEQVAQVRKEIKEAFGKEFKFSVTRQNHSSIDVALMSSPFEFDFKSDYAKENKYDQLNHLYLDNEGFTQEQIDMFKKVTEIGMRGNFDKSDSMTDYFHVGWYFHLAIGKWNKPYITK